MIYFIRSGDAIKIGHSKNDVKGRLSAIKLHSPHETELLGIVLGGRSEEKEIHSLFSRHRIRGEWFTSCEDILAYVETNKIKEPSPSDTDSLAIVTEDGEVIEVIDAKDRYYASTNHRMVPVSERSRQ